MFCSFLYCGSDSFAAFSGSIRAAEYGRRIGKTVELIAVLRNQNAIISTFLGNVVSPDVFKRQINSAAWHVFHGD